MTKRELIFFSFYKTLNISDMFYPYYYDESIGSTYMMGSVPPIIASAAGKSVTAISEPSDTKRVIRHIIRISL